MTRDPKSHAKPVKSESIPANAAEWVVRLDSDQAVWGDKEEFSQWCASSDENRQEFAVHKSLWNAIGQLSDNPEARALLMKQRQAASRRSRRTVLGLLGGGAAAASAALYLAPRLRQPPELEFHTRRGERKDVVLPDGSEIILNTDSLVRVQFQDSERLVFLDQGQFFVKVAEDPSRPLRVFVKDHEVRAIGTAFDVFRDNEQQISRVRLMEGIVAIYNIDLDRNVAALGQPEAVLRPGQQATLAALMPPMIADVDPQIGNAWLAGRIIFEDTPLLEAVRDVNRYRENQILIADDSLKTMRISGVFNIRQLGAFPEALAAALPIQVSSRDDSSVVLRQK